MGYYSQQSYIYASPRNGSDQLAQGQNRMVSCSNRATRVEQERQGVRRPSLLIIFFSPQGKGIFFTFEVQNNPGLTLLLEDRVGTKDWWTHLGVPLDC